MKKLNNKDIEIAVEIDGVYAQGFGMLAQKLCLTKNCLYKARLFMPT